ncbi:unnamed protein product [Coregonus sp. 'balchen']|nr:unnamed protein product [Coregonus sp. 'balchen']
MPTSRLAFDPIIMDAREQANPNLHFGVNGGHDGTKRNSRSRPCEDKALQFLSQEEQDCILFFEETIDSLLTTPAVAELDGPRPPILASTPSPSPSPVPPLSALDRPTSPKDQDIIDLVHPAQPDLVQPIQAPFNPPMPDFTQNMVMNNPERHFENKPRREAMENFPTEYNLPLPGKDSAPYGHALYQPVGSVPTPVLIAQKIAEHQGSGGNTNILSSSLLSNRHRSLDLENIKRPPTSPDYPIKQGPNTSAKPTHYPGNISMIMGSNHHHSHSLASVNLQDRKSQMLANLSGTSHPVEAEELHELQKVRVNLPTRSESFRDPTPNKSRMEALSKLGLTRNRSPSGDLSLLITPNSSTNTKPAAAPIPVATPTPVPTPTPILTPDFNSYGGKTIVVKTPFKGGLPPPGGPPSTETEGNPLKVQFLIPSNEMASTLEDKSLQFLSQEEQDCILFFEETIDSLLTTPAVAELDGPRPPTLASAPSPVPPLSALDRPTSPKDQDIIDLVRPAQPDLVQPIQAPFNPPMPGTAQSTPRSTLNNFTQNMVMNNPERHIENKPRREAMENFPTEYNLPHPGKDSAPYGHALYHPVGSVPTPVLIAQKIAEHQGSGGNTNILSSSLLSNPRRSLDLENIERPPTSPDYPIKQGPTTSAKPTRYPDNISMIMGSNQHHSHSLASVNLQDRKSQMLANLSGTSHPVEAEELHGLQKVQVNLPTRSESFRDPTPNKSRMEALSKLGLTRNRSPSGDLSLLITPNSSTNTKPAAAPIPVATPTPVPTNTPTRTPVSKPVVARQASPLPPSTVNTSSHASIHDNKPASPPPEVSSKDFNSYGGKTIVVNPSKAAAAAPSTGGHGNKAHPVTSHSDFNPYGG